MSLDLAYARDRDRRDPLARFREEFMIAEPDLIYLDGNSLGRLPKRTRARLHAVIDREWGQRLIRSWNEGWYEAPQRVGAKIAQLIGAQPDEVIVSDSTSINFFKLVVAALAARPGRKQIVTESVNFPSDLYILQGVVRWLNAGHRLTVIEPADGLTIPTADVAAAIDVNECALVTLAHTAFKSGYVYDMAAVTEATHRAGALMLWDLSHSVGAMPLALNACGVDLAVGCTYKYLNGGPGAPAFLYVRRDLQPQLLNPIWGWFGQKAQFDMKPTYEPGPGLQRFLVGTPPILALAAVEDGVDLLLEAGLERLREKSVAQTEYLIALWDAYLKPLGVTLNSPRDPNWRGSHVALGHPEGLRIDRALIEQMNVIPDFRYPDNIRLGLAPIYTSFEEVYEAVQRLRRVLDERLYEHYPAERLAVT